MTQSTTYDKALLVLSQFSSYAAGASDGFVYICDCHEDEIREMAELIKFEAASKFRFYQANPGHIVIGAKSIGSWLRGLLASTPLFDHFPRYQLELEDWADRLNYLDPQETEPKVYSKAYYIAYDGVVCDITEFKFTPVKISEPSQQQKVNLSKS
jgi:hypothetical protein